MCIFAAEWFSLSVNFFTARDGVVMFSHNFKQFCILVQITTKGPDLLQNRSRKSPDSSWKSFFSPITTYFSTKSRWQNSVSEALCFTNFTTFAQVIERSVFGELLGEIPKECVECVKLDAVNFTEAEAKLFNEINLKHTSGCFGKDIFSTRDKMVQRDDFEKFVKYLIFCR